MPEEESRGGETCFGSWSLWSSTSIVIPGIGLMVKKTMATDSMAGTAHTIATKKLRERKSEFPGPVIPFKGMLPVM